MTFRIDRRAFAALSAALSMAGCAAFPLDSGGGVNPPSAPAASGWRAGVLADARRVADWQLAHLDRFDYVSTFRDNTADPTDWIQGTLYVGLGDFANATGDARYGDAVIAHGEAQAWGYGDRPRHADDDVIGQAWVWAAQQGAQQARERRLAPSRRRLEPVLQSPSDGTMIFAGVPGEQPCQQRWCWSDALFMSPPLWASMGRITGDRRYVAHMDREFRATVDTLYDRQEHLFYRDTRFLERRSAAGSKIFWSRGNGWAYAGVVRVLKALPDDHPSRPYYLSLYREMSSALVRHQGPEGYWPVSLLELGGPPETSGTAFFVFGLAWGLNNGILTSSRDRTAALNGWSALSRAVQPDGRLGWVQQVGYAPDRVSADDTQLYGVGAYLMAASEIADTQW